MRNQVERAIENALWQEIHDLRRQVQEMRAVQKTLITLGGADAANGELKLYGQALAIYDQPGTTLLGYLSGVDPLGGGNLVLMAGASGQGVALVAGALADGPVKAFGTYLKIPSRGDDPADAGDNGAMWWRADLAELRFWSGGTKYKGGFVPA